MKSAPLTLWGKLAEVAGLVATPLVPSHYIGLVAPLAATHTRKARVEAVHAETADTRTLTLRPGRGWRAHRPGQHVAIGIAIDGRIATRMYSISSAPGRRDGCFTITVKAQGRVSRALGAVVPGTYLTIGLPAGDFVLPEGPGPRLFVTAGSGITPVMAMLRDLAPRGELRGIVHLHFARTEADVIFGGELRALAVDHPGYRLAVVHTAIDPRRFSPEWLDEQVPDWRTRETWACGPQGLLASVTECFERAGRASALHVERFAPVLAPLPAATGEATVRFTTTATEARAGRRTPLLRIAEDAGIAAPHGCRMGICHTCDTILVSGCVRDLRTGEQIAEPGTRIQVCVCAAESDVELAL